MDSAALKLTETVAGSPTIETQPAVPPATNGVSAGQVLLDSEAPHE